MAKNVLLILADQWRGDALSCLGHACARSPHLDALAAEGALFRRHYAQCAPCGPARASIFTGLYLHNHRVVANGAPLDARLTNLALEARKAGYAPALFGYTDQTPDPRGLSPDDPSLRTYEGVLPGFDAIVHMPERQEPWLRWLKAQGYDPPWEPLAIYRPVHDGAGRGPTFAPPAFKAEHSESAFLTGEALAWLEANGDRPFFLHLAYLRPHPPWIAPEPWNALVHPDSVPPIRRAATMAEEGASHPFLAAWLARNANPPVHRGPGPQPAEMSEAELRQLRATYFGLCAQLDSEIGRLVAWLKANGRWNDTLVLFSADHGEMLGDRWMVGKDGFFDAAFHVPLIVRAPGAHAGVAIDAFSEHVDLMPTILDWLGLPPARQGDGRSLLPFLRGERSPGWREAAHWEFDFRRRVPLGLPAGCANLVAHRGERFKYVRFAAALPPLLFDLLEDPGETRNLAADPGYAGARAEAETALLDWRMASDLQTLADYEAGPAGLIDHRR